MMDVNRERPQEKQWFRRPANLALLGFLAIAAFFLLSEHRAHFFGVLPYLLLLACPFLHLFMHRDHDDHDHHGTERGQK